MELGNDGSAKGKWEKMIVMWEGKRIGNSYVWEMMDLGTGKWER